MFSLALWLRNGASKLGGNLLDRFGPDLVIKFGPVVNVVFAISFPWHESIQIVLARNIGNWLAKTEFHPVA